MIFRSVSSGLAPPENLVTTALSSSSRGPAWRAAGAANITDHLVEEEIGQTRCLVWAPPPSPLSNGGVGFLSCLAGTSKRWAESYKRALISVEPPNPRPSIPLPCSGGGWAEGWAATVAGGRGGGGVVVSNISWCKAVNVFYKSAP